MVGVAGEFVTPNCATPRSVVKVTPATSTVGVANVVRLFQSALSDTSVKFPVVQLVKGLDEELSQTLPVPDGQDDPELRNEL